MIATADYTKWFFMLMAEIFGVADTPNGFILDTGQSGLLGTIHTLSAETASSAPTPEQGTIAAHCGHLLFHLNYFAAYERGETPAVNWADSWKISVVDEQEWQALCHDLQTTYDDSMARLQIRDEWHEPAVAASLMLITPQCLSRRRDPATTAVGWNAMNPLAVYFMNTALYGAYIAGFLHLRTAAAEQRWLPSLPRTTIAMVMAIGVPSVLQFRFPAILFWLEWDATRIFAGELWRLVTALFVQDGGVSGTMFNLVGLCLVGTVAEYQWGVRRWLVIFFLGGIVSECVGLFWQPIGAGNSVANFSLAASIAVWLLRKSTDNIPRLIATLALAAGAGLLALRDIHGAAVLFGSVIGLVLTMG